MIQVESDNFVAPFVFIHSGRDCQWLFKNGLIYMSCKYHCTVLLLITKTQGTFTMEQSGGSRPNEVIKFSVTNGGTT